MSNRTLFVGDVHGCAEELDALLTRAAADRIILLGDLFTKGPDPDGVWDLIQSSGAEAIRGNHDDFVLRRWALRGQALAPQPAITWLKSLPLFLEEDGWIAVHAGLHPTEGRAGTDHQTATRVRRWPDDTDEQNPFWWELYHGLPLVIYGHDARRMLQDHRPQTLGLDTGCVYGGRLTGYLLEEDAIISVDARRAYQAV
ncbi:MAG: metallophosphoesterase [Myxococcota bacterium]